MRKSKEELLERFPNWNKNKHDIIKATYGDIPLIKYDEEWYKNYKTLSGTLSNINGVEAYMYIKNGTYYEYRTEIGSIYIKKNGEVMCGNITVQYRNKYTIILNKMYNHNGLDILNIGSKNIVGFSNKDGQGSPSIYTKEIDTDIIDKILDLPLKDYGESIHKFMSVCREVYDMDNTNYIMNKRFGIKRS